jgi:hypothetical protein
LFAEFLSKNFQAGLLIIDSSHHRPRKAPVTVSILPGAPWCGFTHLFVQSGIASVSGTTWSCRFPASAP